MQVASTAVTSNRCRVALPLPLAPSPQPRVCCCRSFKQKQALAAALVHGVSLAAAQRGRLLLRMQLLAADGTDLDGQAQQHVAALLCCIKVHGFQDVVDAQDHAPWIIHCSIWACRHIARTCCLSERCSPFVLQLPDEWQLQTACFLQGIASYLQRSDGLLFAALPALRQQAEAQLQVGLGVYRHAVPRLPAPPPPPRPYSLPAAFLVCGCHKEPSRNDAGCAEHH